MHEMRMTRGPWGMFAEMVEVGKKWPVRGAGERRLAWTVQGGSVRDVDGKLIVALATEQEAEAWLRGFQTLVPQAARKRKRAA